MSILSFTESELEYADRCYDDQTPEQFRRTRAMFSHAQAVKLANDLKEHAADGTLSNHELALWQIAEQLRAGELEPEDESDEQYTAFELARKGVATIATGPYTGKTKFYLDQNSPFWRPEYYPGELPTR
jgi:hypothetical protein